MHHAVAHVLSNMCASTGEDDLLLQHGVVGMVQNLIGNVKLTETICFLLLRYVVSDNYTVFTVYTLCFSSDVQ